MILASASPRRKELLERAGFTLSVESSDIDETRHAGESPLSLVERLAIQKAHATLEQRGALAKDETLLSADTIVWTDDEVLGKPHDEADAIRMLRALSGRSHCVSTGVCLMRGTSSATPMVRSFVETTTVTFRRLTDEQIAAYVATGEPMDKAGSYGIQGGARAFVSALEGDYDNVVGLPVTRVVRELEHMKEDVSMTSITQIPGIYAAHVTHEEGGTGCTVIVCPKGATGAVDVRGGAPATRETDLLRPEETVQQVHAIMLSGGSAYGLAASCGAAEELERAGIGLNVGVGVVPIVSSACLFDLAVGDSMCRPTMRDGATAVHRALAELDVPAPDRTPLQHGNVGAGTGCTVGKIAGPSRAMKSGMGEAIHQQGELTCGAVVAVNACGDVIDPSTGKPIAGLLDEGGQAVASSTNAILSLATMSPDDGLLKTNRTNTTISCVVTNAQLSKAEATKVAQMAADAYARTILPVHTTNDGDTIFVMATGEVQTHVDVVATLATKTLEDAIVDAVRSATGAYGLKAARDLR